MESIAERQERRYSSVEEYNQFYVSLLTKTQWTRTFFAAPGAHKKFAMSISHQWNVKNVHHHKHNSLRTYVESDEFSHSNYPRIRFALRLYHTRFFGVHSKIVNLVLKRTPGEEYSVPISVRCSIVDVRGRKYETEGMNLDYFILL